jgi:hypothetical protein
MCFSATASFSVAATTAIIGIALLKHVRQPREILVAAVPLLFAFQQSVEGILWLQLSGEADTVDNASLTMAFLLFAQVLWPAYTAIAVLVIEPDPRRKLFLGIIAAAGFALSTYLSISLFGDPQTATIQNHSIAYANKVNPFSWRQLPYVICTCIPPLISSHRPIQIFGLIILVGFFVSAYFYFATFISVWCFFAAAGSLFLFFCFKRDALRAAYSRA